MNYPEKLILAALKSNSIVCLGMDPVIEEIPLKEQSPEVKIVKFYNDILEATGKDISAVKLNYAYFAQYGFAGLRALKKMLANCKNRKILTILDAKRGDIGKSSEAYARELFDFWKCDATTIAPYMGKDSVEPFISYCGKGKGAYILVRTSNSGANDFQEAVTGSKKLYMTVAEKLTEWHRDGVGAVVGATSVNELSTLAKFFAESGKTVPMLIPGVGTQGGSAKEVADALKKFGEIKMHRINSSSGISYAYKKQGTTDYAGAAAKEVKKLNGEIGL